MSDDPRGPGLGRYLQGVQHVGITVYDMAKSMEFYTEVLGGKVAVQGDGCMGEIMGLDHRVGHLG
jgi:catechol 2,3-dioxygenase-like lactoylglutathione lyase family enzyme